MSIGIYLIGLLGTLKWRRWIVMEESKRVSEDSAFLKGEGWWKCLTSVEIGWRKQVCRSSGESPKLEIRFRVAWSENKGPNQISLGQLWLLPNSTILIPNKCIAKDHQTFILRPKNSGHSPQESDSSLHDYASKFWPAEGAQNLMDSCSVKGSYSSTNSA